MKHVASRMSLRILATFAMFIFFSLPGWAQRGQDAWVVVLKQSALAERGVARKDLRQNEASAAIAATQQTLLAKAAERGVRTLGASQVLLNALYVRATDEQVAALKALPEVESVQRMRPLRRHINKALDLVNARAAWNQLGGGGQAGNGVKIAILDTGIDPNHPAFRNFSGRPPEGYPKCREQAGDCRFTNNKIIAARSYVDLLNFAFGTNPNDTRPDDNSPADRDGHGTATAMMAAAQEHDSPIGRISGAAPRAFLGNYKVFGSNGINEFTFPNVVIRALEDAIADDMDIASLNLGQPAGYGALDNICGESGTQPCDAFARAVQNAVNLGLIVTVSAGNSGDSGPNFPSYNTISSPATAPKAIAVGATTNSHIWYNTLTVLGNGVPADLQTVNFRFTNGPQITAPLEGPLVDVGSISSNRLACAALPDNSLNSRIALVERGTCTLAEKVTNAQRAGAIAVVITNFEGGAVFQLTSLDGTGIPSGLIGFNAGNALRAFLSNQERNVRLNPAFREVSASADEIAVFSARGPAIGDYGVKPDLVAVGTDLYVATQSLDPSGGMFAPGGYTVVDGTSFSAPLVAGLAALVKQDKPNLRPEQVKSVLVNTGSTVLVDYDNNDRQIQAPIAAMGGGKADAVRALRANLSAEPSALAFGLIDSASFPSLGLVLTNLAASGSLNLSARVETRTAASSVNVTVTPSNFALLAGQETQLTVRLGGTRPAPGRYEGFIVISGGATELRIPYSFYSGPAAAFNMYSLAGGFFEAIPSYRQSVLMKVVDEFGIPVRGVAVVGRVVSGNGRITFANERTDEYGIAEAVLEAGQNLGEQVFRFTAGNLFADFVANVIPRPAIAAGGIRDAASGEASTAFTAGQYISIFGTGLSPNLRVFSGNQLALSLSRVSVSFDNEAERVSAPGRLQFVSNGQINVQIPWECAGLATVDMKVSIGEFASAVQTLRLRAANPAPFEYTEGGTNRRLVAALDGNFALISTANPVRRGQVAQLYVNGMGAVDATPGSGQVSPANPLARTNATPVVRIGGQNAQVIFSGLAPGIVGLYQVNVIVPENAATGPETELTIQQSGVTSRTARIPVQ